MEFMELQLKQIHMYMYSYGINVHCVHVGHGICARGKRVQTHPYWLGRMNHMYMYMYYGIHVHVYTLHMYVCTCIYIAHIKRD